MDETDHFEQLESSPPEVIPTRTETTNEPFTLGPNHRRLAFDAFIQCIDFTGTALGADEVTRVLVSLYFVLFQILNAYNRMGHGQMDGGTIHFSIFRVLHDIIRGNYDSLYQLLFET